MKKLFFITAMAVLISKSAYADDVDSANRLCALLDQTGLTSQKCEYSVWRSEVTTVIDMSAGEARELCTKIANSSQSMGFAFQRKWTLQIRSPYSGSSSIAFCAI